MKTLCLSNEVKPEIIAVLESGAAGGFQGTTFKVIRQINRICAALESTGNECVLEESDFELLYSRLNEFAGWNAGKPTRKLVMEISDALEAARASET